MAESADVRLAIANIIEGIVYPSGTGQPSAVPGLSGKCAIYQSWPKPDDLDQRLPAGDLLISVTEWGDGVSMKRFPVADQVVSQPEPTLAWDVVGTRATLSGTISVPQNLAMIVDGIDYLHPVASGDTLASIAANFAALISADQPATSSGAIVIVPGAHLIVARVGVVAQTLRETGRQKSSYVVSVWAQTEALRKAAVTLVKAYLDDQRRMTLPDGSGAWIRSGHEMPIVTPAKLGIARTNILYPVEFASTIPGTAPQAIVWRVYLNQEASDGSTIVPPIAVLEA